MNDDHNPDLWLLAGDYLDGALDAAERARVESDPALMTAVGELRALHGELRAVAPASAGVRQAAISAALSEFDSLHARREERVVRPIESAPRRRSSRYSPERWLSAVAAAVVLLGGLGLVVASGLTGGDDDDDAAEDIALDAATGADQAFEQAAADTDVVLGADAGSARSATTAAEADSAEETATAADGGSEPMSATGLPPLADAPAPTAAPAATGPATSSYTFVPEQPIDGVEQLAAAADQLLVREQAGELVNTPETCCGGTDGEHPLRVLSEGLYRAPDAIEREIFVAVDEADGMALALDRSSCETVAEAPLP
jgi:hypothetical protein